MNGEFDPDGVDEEERVARIIDLEGDPLDTRICVALTPDDAEPQGDAGL
jgi:hypothetical protein